MFEFEPPLDLPKPVLYSSLAKSAAELVRGERDPIANMANLASLIWNSLPDLNWAGFYRVIDDQLVLGPFIGKPACIRIDIGSGVCGTAAALGATQIVPNVHEFPGHIACDPESRSELVVPVVRYGQVLGVIDLDSPLIGRFDEADASGMRLVAIVAADVM